MERYAGPGETLESRCFSPWCGKMIFLVLTQFCKRTYAIFWDPLMDTSDHHRFSVHGDKNIQAWKNLWSFLVRLIILIHSARNDALG